MTSLVRLSSLSSADIRIRLRGAGLALHLKPFNVRLRSRIPVVEQGISALYADYPLLTDEDAFVDFHLEVSHGRRFVNSQCIFRTDGDAPFSPLALGEAFALFEWGLNWCVTGYCHTWITIHSAVLERNGRALLLPAPPGSGKSTLCAALMLDGWRLLSDEMALLDPATGRITPSPRPVSLKNQSIELLRKRAPQAVIGPVAYDTKKGTVAHLQVSRASVERAAESVLPAWVVFPKYEAGAATALTARGKATSFMQLAENSFNQQIHGRAGFTALSDLTARVDCHDFHYSNIDDALEVFARMAASA